MSIKIHIDHTRLKKLFALNFSYYAIKKRTGYPIGLIAKIKKGEEIKYFKPRNRPKPEDKKICNYCKIRPKGEKKRFLCDVCFHHADDGSLI